MGNRKGSLEQAEREQRTRNDAEAILALGLGRNATELKQHRRRIEAQRQPVAKGKLTRSQIDHLIRQHPELATATRAVQAAKVLAYIDAAIAAIDLRLKAKRPTTRRYRLSGKNAAEMLANAKKEVAAIARQ